MPSLRRRRSSRLAALSLAAATSGLAAGVVTASPASAEPTPDPVVKACDSDHCSPAPEGIAVTPPVVVPGQVVTVEFRCDIDVAVASGEITGPSGEGPVSLSVVLDGLDAVGTATVPTSWSAGDAELDLTCGYGGWDEPASAAFVVLAPPPPPPTTVPPTTAPAPPTTLPAAPPASMGTLDVSVTSLLPGGTTELVATGYQPGSEVRFVIYSEPVLLGTAVAGADGVARLLATLPPGLPLGAHTVVSMGSAPEGTERVLSQSVTVAEPLPAAAPATLARTGGASAQLTLVGTLLVGAGALALGARRRALAPR